MLTISFTFYMAWLISSSILVKPTQSLVDYTYHNYERLTSILKDYSVKYPNKTHLYSIGKSVRDRDIWVISIAARQPDVHLILRPEVKLIGNIHGNELPSGELLLQFIDYLLVNPVNDPSVDYILKNIRVHILVSLNPDGAELALASSPSCDNKIGKDNANHFDLNNNFPDKFVCNRKPIQPETKAIIDWLETNTFVLSAKFQTGFIVASFPWENYRITQDGPNPKRLSDIESPTDYEDMFTYLASRYSFNHLTMANETCDQVAFQDGITNGARHDRIKGGMQDFNFWHYGCAELTIGISCCISPTENKLSELWQANTKSLIEFTKRANTGIRGVIEFKNRGPARYVGVRFDTREPIFKTNSLGEYYALLVPGVYTLSVVFTCDLVLYTTEVEVLARSRLLVVNITLSEADFELANSYRLDKYPLFCIRSNQPVDCHDPSSTSSSDGEDESHHGHGHSHDHADENSSIRNSFNLFGLIISSFVALFETRSSFIRFRY